MNKRMTIATFVLIISLIFVSTITMVSVFAEGQDIMNNMISGLTKSVLPEIASPGRLTGNEDLATDNQKSTTDAALSDIGNVGDNSLQEETTDSSLDASASGAGADSMDSLMDKMTNGMVDMAKKSGNDMDLINKMLGIFSAMMAMAMLVSCMKMVSGMLSGNSKGGSATKELGLDQLFGGADGAKNATADGSEDAAADGSEDAAANGEPTATADDTQKTAGTETVPDDVVTKVQNEIEALPFKGATGNEIDEGQKVTASAPFVAIAEIVKNKVEAKEKFSAKDLVDEVESQQIDVSESVNFINYGSNFNSIKSIFAKYFPKSSSVINAALDSIKAKADAATKANKTDPDADLPSEKDNSAHDAAVAAQPDYTPTAEDAAVGADSAPENTDTQTPEAP